jgi:hypothetical protein
MDTITHTPKSAKAKTPKAKAAPGLKDLAIASKTLNMATIVVAPEGHKEEFDDRIYACLNSKATESKDKVCGNRGSVNGGAFTRSHSDTVCLRCGSSNNRWEREALV